MNSKGSAHNGGPGAPEVSEQHKLVVAAENTTWKLTGHDVPPGF